MLEDLATRLDKAAVDAIPTEQLTTGHAITLEDAYEIQRLSVAHRLERGEHMSGYKLGFTSRAKMEQMGVSDLIWGRLTDAMAIASGGQLAMRTCIHPRAEPEIAFLMKRELSGTVTLEEAMDAVEAVAPAIEIIDSRFSNFKFSHIDVVADNCSSTAYVLGEWQAPDFDLGGLKMTLSINDSEVASGLSDAILDHPANALVEAARCLAEGGAALLPGQVLLAGAATAAVALNAGDSVRVDIERLGSCGFQSVDGSLS